MIIGGFPGIGKTYAARNLDFNIIDTDSSKFSKSQDFPKNYVDHVSSFLDHRGFVRIILVSTHAVSLDAFLDNGLLTTLVYPDIGLKDEYIARYAERGDDDKFIQLIGDNWEDWIMNLRINYRDVIDHYVLSRGEYLSDYFKKFQAIE